MKRFFAVAIERSRLVLRYDTPDILQAATIDGVSPVIISAGVLWNRNGTMLYGNPVGGSNSPTRWKDPENVHNFDGFFEVRARVDTATLPGTSTYDLFGSTPAIGVFSPWISIGGAMTYQVGVRRAAGQVSAQINGTAEIRYRDYPVLFTSRAFIARVGP